MLGTSRGGRLVVVEVVVTSSSFSRPCRCLLWPPRPRCLRTWRLKLEDGAEVDSSMKDARIRTAREDLCDMIITIINVSSSVLDSINLDRTLHQCPLLQRFISFLGNNEKNLDQNCIFSCTHHHHPYHTPYIRESWQHCLLGPSSHL